MKNLMFNTIIFILIYISAQSQANTIGITASTNAIVVCPITNMPMIRGPDSAASTGGYFDSIRKSNGKNYIHGALDINSPKGTPVYAVHDGIVGVAGTFGNMGNTVIIDHKNGEYSIYGHLDSVLVQNKDTVSAGLQIGTVGYTGNAANLEAQGLSAHLHFALIRAGMTGLAEINYPIAKMKEWADMWAQKLGAEAMGPLHPSLVLSPGLKCWIDPTQIDTSSQIGAPNNLHIIN